MIAKQLTGEDQSDEELAFMLDQRFNSSYCKRFYNRNADTAKLLTIYPLHIQIPFQTLTLAPLTRVFLVRC
jgi:hypothetical protein